MTRPIASPMRMRMSALLCTVAMAAAGSRLFLQPVVALHDNEDVAAHLETKLVSEIFESNTDRPDLFTYGRSTYLIGPFDLPATSDEHNAQVFDGLVAWTLPALRGVGPGYITRLSTRVLKTVDFAASDRSVYASGDQPVNLKNFAISKYYPAAGRCNGRRMSITDTMEFDGARLDIPLPYGVGFGPNRPLSDHEWHVWLRLEDIRTAIGPNYVGGAQQFVVEYTAYWTEDPQVIDAHAVFTDALGCPIEDTRHSLELGPAEYVEMTDKSH